ncbi:MAG: cysteine synthase A [Deltaproteobacteria bacterium]|nr:cysteine synthase A [Deltaproteobacteria bacterium]
MTDGRTAPRATIASSVLDLIGRTPLVRLDRIAPKDGAEIVAKLEGMNPGGSAKDRVAYRMVLAAEAEGRLGPGSTVIEGTSGNTGIGLAMVCAARGYRCVIVMPDSMSLERIYLVQRLGAEVVLTPAKDDLAGAVRKAEELAAKTPGAFLPRQFENANNPGVHATTTAEELLEATGGRIDAFVAGVGTGGTITGVGRVLRERCPGVCIVAVEPDGSAVLSGERPGRHKIQGIGAGFVPKVLDRGVIDAIVRVRDIEAFEAMKRLGALEGINAGISAGAAVHVALEVASRLRPGQRVVTVFPDTGERYLSLQHYFEF